MKNKANMNIIFAGVGGQGILLASDTVCDVALLEGYDAKKSEVHGMAQRGGSVVSQVRFGEKVYSPLIPLATCDVIVSFEKLEALRYLDYLKPGGLVVINDYQIVPETVQLGEAPYPKDVVSICGRRAGMVIAEKLTDLAVEMGNMRILNIIMLGVTSHFLPFKEVINWKYVNDIMEYFVTYLGNTAMGQILLDGNKNIRLVISGHLHMPKSLLIRDSILFEISPIGYPREWINMFNIEELVEKRLKYVNL
jgi:indolepyruvate ferredoxin oxidoreductase beta subunit